jgi:hypothetical protein
MHGFNWFWTLFALSAIVVTGGPIWIAIKARPLASAPYRWATWIAVETTLLSLVVLCSGIPIVIKRGMDTGAVLYLLLSVLGLVAAVGLFRRMRLGVIFLIASELYLIVLGPMLETLYHRPETKNPSLRPFALLVLVVANLFYFSKRWKSMQPVLGWKPAPPPAA